MLFRSVLDLEVLVVNFHISNHQDFQVQYAHLFAGEFIKRTGSPRDVESLFLQYCYRW